MGRATLTALLSDFPPPSRIAVLLQPDAPHALNEQWESLRIRTQPHEACIAFLQSSSDAPSTTSPSFLWSLTSRWSWPFVHAQPDEVKPPSRSSVYALPLLAGLLLINAIVLQYTAWNTQRAAQRLEHETRTLVQTTWRIPMVIDPVAQAKQHVGSPANSPHVVLDALARAGLSAPSRIDASPSVLRVTFPAPPPRLPQDIVAPSSTKGSTLEWKLDTP